MASTTTILLALAVSLAAAFSPAPGNNNLYCDTCTEVAGELESKGCELACESLPAPGDVICSWIFSMTGLCEVLIKMISGGESPQEACADLGLCGSNCECGACTQASAGAEGRCLGVPSSCGHYTSSLPGWAREALAPKHVERNLRVCLDGQCDGSSSSYGC